MIKRLEKEVFDSTGVHNMKKNSCLIHNIIWIRINSLLSQIWP